jgi:hypothetical protein
MGKRSFRSFFSKSLLTCRIEVSRLRFDKLEGSWELRFLDFARNDGDACGEAGVEGGAAQGAAPPSTPPKKRKLSFRPKGGISYFERSEKSKKGLI